jgi:dTDP-4-dehydrorhamnose 3,5-epimerase
MSKWSVEKTGMDGLWVLTPKVRKDDRGRFCEVYHQPDFAALGFFWRFLQENQSVSKRGVLRGLHFQVTPPQAKLVRVAFGSVIDVAVDLRRESPTFGKWYSVELSAENAKMVYLPERFAHGFLSLEAGTTTIYHCSEVYHPESDSGIRWNDETLAIDWTLEDHGIQAPLISEKDQKLMSFQDFLKSGGFS